MMKKTSPGEGLTRRKITTGALAALVAGTVTRSARAGTLKSGSGTWAMRLTLGGLGTIPVSFQFKAGGKGEMQGPTVIPFVYREKAYDVAISMEVPAEASPAGAAVTIVMRGTVTNDTSMSGTLMMITDVPDQSSLGYVTTKATFTGTKT